MARRSLNENGCSDKDKLKGEFMYATLDVCKDFCKGTRFLQYHESTYCGCFLGCDFKRPASEYDSKADVYILEFWYDIINKITIPDDNCCHWTFLCHIMLSKVYNSVCRSSLVQ